MKLAWPRDGLTAELLVDQGMPHGSFKVVAENPATGDRVWTTGQAANGTVEKECWVVTETQVFYFIRQVRTQ